MKDVSNQNFEKDYKMFLIEEFAKREAALINLENILYEEIDINDSKMKLMDSFWHIREYEC